MPPLFNRLLPAVALLAVGTVALPGDASAADGGLITKGVYNGIWHGDKVKVIIEKVSRDGKFSGQLRFDPKGRFPDAKADFTGEIGARDAVVIKRTDCEQTAKAGAPKRDGKVWHWRGEVSGEGLEKAEPFELKVPR